jgi:hypothetical protein
VHPEACAAVPAAPFYHLGRLALVPGYDVNFIDLSAAFQLHGRCPSDQTLTEMFGHRLYIRGVQAQFLSDLPIGKVQPHQVEAQNPHTERLMVPGQHRAAEVVEPCMAGLAQIALPMPLSVIMAIADDDDTVAVRTAQPSGQRC